MPRVLITGARAGGIAAGCALTMADRGWDVALGHWGVGPDEISQLVAGVRGRGLRATAVAADLERRTAPAELFEAAERDLGGPFDALVVCHCRDVELALLDTTAEEFDRHFIVNARAVALLIQEFARRFQGGDGRIVAFTSDALEQNAPYGIGKGALDRVIVAAARELGERGIRANAVNPGPTETGWISDRLRRELSRQTPLRRLGLPSDAAHLVGFLLSPEGGWITGQVLRSDGGLG